MENPPNMSQVEKIFAIAKANIKAKRFEGDHNIYKALEAIIPEFKNAKDDRSLLERGRLIAIVKDRFAREHREATRKRERRFSQGPSVSFIERSLPPGDRE